MSKDKDAMSSVIDDYILTALLQLSLSVEERTVVLVAKALYNVTTVDTYIKRLCDFGIVEGLQELLVNEFCKTNEELQRNISASLYNISCEKECHLSMVSKNAVSMLQQVWDITSIFEVKRYCALSVCHLSCGYVNSAKIVGQGGTKIVCWLSLAENLKECDGSWCVAR